MTEEIEAPHRGRPPRIERIEAEGAIETPEKPSTKAPLVTKQGIETVPADVAALQHGEPVIALFANGYKAWYPRAYAENLLAQQQIIGIEGD